VTVTWRVLTEADLADLLDLAARVQAADGGHPMAVTGPFLIRRYLAPTVRSHAAFVDGQLVAAGAVRPVGDRQVSTGLVDPDARTGGLGSSIVDWAREAGAAQVETEGLTDDADALYTANGLRRTFAEDVMAYDLSRPAPPQVVDADLRAWSDEDEARFYAVYHAAFRDRPGFPDWTRQQWVDWLTDDDEFAPEWTLLATRDGQDIGFVACGYGAWLVQVGVAPAARGEGLGAGLTAEVLRRMRAAGETVCYLDVNVNNPGAIRVYERLGFARIGRRARYEWT
jgi:mycothiol synthase